MWDNFLVDVVSTKVPTEERTGGTTMINTTLEYKGVKLDTLQMLKLQNASSVEFCEAVGTEDACVPTPVLDGERRQLDACGFWLLDSSENDEVFTRAFWPAGWSCRAEGTPKLLEVLDDLGRVRGAIYYSAAPGNRNSLMVLFTRYGWTIEQSNEGQYYVAVKDRSTGEVLMKSMMVVRDTKRNRSIAVDQCEAWLDENFPEWSDAASYWDN